MPVPALVRPSVPPPLIRLPEKVVELLSLLAVSVAVPVGPLGPLGALVLSLVLGRLGQHLGVERGGGEELGAMLDAVRAGGRP